MFAARLPLRPLALVSRSLGTLLSSGVDISKAFQLAGQKSSSAALRRAMDDVSVRLRSGEDVSAAMQAQGIFPELFINMVTMAEQTGSLPEVLRDLSLHYERNIRLRKDLVSQLTTPVIQLVAAVLIIALLIAMLGWIAESGAGPPIDVLGWGLLGTSGAMIWLGGWAILVAAGLLLYKLAMNSLAGQKTVHEVLLGVPVVGRCMRSFAIARFSWAFYLTQNSGMPIEDSLDLSLRVTANGAFIARRRQMIDDVMSGETLTEAFDHSGLFPTEFIEMVHVGETSGTVPEALHRLSPQFEEQAHRALAALSTALAYAVKAGVTIFIAFVVLSIGIWYASILNGAVQGL